MEVTKNDLSYNHTKLDFEALLQTAQLAYSSRLREISARVSKLSAYPSIGNTSRWLEAHWLAEDTKALAIIAETLSTLLEAKDREEIEIVNKPEVTKDATN